MHYSNNNIGDILKYIVFINPRKSVLKGLEKRCKLQASELQRFGRRKQCAASFYQKLPSI